jgi:transcriptional regulator with XRE-family HTH domain
MAQRPSRKDYPRLDEGVRRRIRELRVERGLTQEQLCERAGISIDAVSRIEGGSRVPTLDTIERLAKAFAVSPTAILERGPAGAEPRPPLPLRNIVALLEGQPEELQRLAQQLVAILVRAYSVGGRGGYR